MKAKSVQDIILMKENTVGSDIIIGDVHGNADCFKQLLATLKPTDRLFIVGDLTDRGHNSPEVIRQILQHKEQVFCTRGNHESLCLETIKALEILTEYKHDFIFNDKHLLREYIKSNEKSPQKLIKLVRSLNDAFAYGEEYQSLANSIINGGSWIIDLFLKELANKSIECQQEGEVQYKESSEVKSIKDLMKSLPYIIHVAGEKPFNIVHADMPFEDKELYKRIVTNKVKLTKGEKEYATWSRENDSKFTIRTCNRNPGSIPTYVGHTPIVKKGENVPVVRYDSNAMNLDVGAYSTNVLLVVNHTKGTAYYVGGKEQVNEYMLEIQAELEKHLQNNPYNPSLYNLNVPAVPKEKEVKASLVKVQKETQAKYNLDRFWKPLCYDRIPEEDKQDTYLDMGIMGG